MRSGLVYLLPMLLVGSVMLLVNAADQDEAAEQKPKYEKPVVNGFAYFMETFESNTIGTKWVKSKAKKEDVDEIIAKYDGVWSIESALDAALEGDLGLVLKSRARHHAISTRLAQPFSFTRGKPLVVQYEVKFQNALECGGAYVKLLEQQKEDPADLLDSFFDKTSFSIMFGPDKCGTESKVHFIIRFRNPKTGTVEEKHAKKSELVDAYFSDGKTHLYTLVVRPDNTYKILIDTAEVSSGSLLTDFTPAINPPREIVDPEDKKPESWDDREKIPDPDAVKPDEWDEDEPKQIADPSATMPSGWLEDEEAHIADPAAKRPEDWDDETDGEWEAPKIENPKCAGAPGCGKWSPPLINNPKYKGKWRAPLIENPNYQGKWEPRKIANPEFFEDSDPFKSLMPFSAMGLELWSMTDQIYFDNFLITDDENTANEFAKATWLVKKEIEVKKSASASSDSVIDGLLKAANDKPWLWAIYLLIILLPVVLVAIFCFGGSKKPSPSSEAAAAAAKKTDAPTEDVIPEGEEEQLVDESNQAREDEEEDEDDESAEKIGKEDLEGIEDDLDEKEPENESSTGSPKKSDIKKRLRTRKD